jgi:hypothetical protein
MGLSDQDLMEGQKAVGLAEEGNSDSFIGPLRGFSVAH